MKCTAKPKAAAKGIRNADRKVCHLCKVTLSLSWPDHLDTLRHQAARKLAKAALSRLRASLEPPPTTTTTTDTGTGATVRKPTNVPTPTPAAPVSSTCKKKEDISNPEEPKVDKNAKQVFCTTCIWPFVAIDNKHLKSEHHVTASKFEQVLEVLVRAYAEEEDLVLMDIPPKENGPKKYVTETENYRCHICNICDVLKQFRTEHENSIHHRANLACAHSAIKRIRAQLAPPDTADLPLEDHRQEDMRLLLKAFAKR